MDFLRELGPMPVMALGIVFSLLIGALVLLILTRSELRQIRENYNALLEYLGDGESRDILRELTSLIRDIESDNRETEKDIEQIFSVLESCIQKVSIIRYNAFHNVGSDQSFSIALLDREDDGVVVSGIYGRDSSTTYAKPIKAGVSEYMLTEEEENAIGLARKQYSDAMSVPPRL